MSRVWIPVVLLASSALISGCMINSQPDTNAHNSKSATSTDSHQNSLHQNSTVCHAIYDAGSSGTRLYLYQQTAAMQQGGQWLSHEGPKVAALADPVREIRGKTWADVGSVTDEVVQALEDLRQDGPLKKGKPEWQGFDWQAECQLQSVRVLATAGMRIAEQENRQRSAELWQMLKQKLQQTVGGNVQVDTRTLTGYEEGLYAWLALQDSNRDNAYGVAEMGGASSQVTFPCTACDNSHDAVRKVLVDGQAIKIYSYSFLGLGQDEAPKTLAFPKTCAYGVGLQQPDWVPQNCAAQIPLTAGNHGLKDPYNYADGHQGTVNQPPIALGEQQRWFLTGAFSYMQASDLQDCCMTKGQCYNAQTSCFSTVYRPKYLQTLNIPVNSMKADVSWTEGANLCGTTDCLSEAKAPVCRWSKEGCL